MINILYISHFPHLKMGGQKSMTALIKNLNRDEFCPFAILPEAGELSEELEKINCKTFMVPLKSLKPKYISDNFKNIQLIRQIIKNNNIDIIHPDHERDSIIGGIAKLFTNAKMVWHVRLTRGVESDNLSCKLSDGIIGISSDIKERFSKFKHIDKKYITIYNGVDCSIFKPVDSKKDAKIKLGYNADEFIICYAGQFKIGKGIFDLLEAARIIKQDYSKKIKFLMIGTPESSEIVNEMSAYIENNSLDNVCILSQQSKIQDFMQASDILILPSHEKTEGMGRVLFEAMACGTPVIATNVKGVREAVTGATGILIPEKSPNNIAVAVYKYFNDENFRVQAAIESRKRALEVFDISIHARNVEKFYKKILIK